MDSALTDAGATYSQASGDFKFAAAVASFALLLRGSPNAGTASYDSVAELAGEGLSFDPGGWRKEFLDLVAKAKALPPLPK
jgi:Ca-activated chloride channel family protein